MSPGVSVGTDHFESLGMYRSHNTYIVDGNEASFTQNDMFGYRNEGHGLNLNARFYSQ